MHGKLLITGSSGLVGTALCAALARAGFSVVPFDLQPPPPAGSLQELHDICDSHALARAMAGCTGVVHLAAVSRVLWGQQDPERCWATNVGGTRNVLDAARAAPERPWVLIASSREVYGQPAVLPASEDCPLAPVNIYGRSKAAGEELLLGARAAGLQGAIVRLSNVYGSTSDHADRVVPAFARHAALGQSLRVDGRNHTFDFTHIEDVIRGLLALIHALMAGERSLPPIHLVTGHPTTLGELAALARELAGTGSDIVEAPPRSYDVARFHGNPARARTLLGWEPGIDICAGLKRLITEFRGALTPTTE